jgi:hypothetical protein
MATIKAWMVTVMSGKEGEKVIYCSKIEILYNFEVKKFIFLKIFKIKSVPRQNGGLSISPGKSKIHFDL